MRNMMKETEQVRVKSTRLTGALVVGFSTIRRLADDRDACAHSAVCVPGPFWSTNSDGWRAWRYPEHGTRRETYEPRSGELETQLDGSACRTKKLNPRAHAEKPLPMYPIATRTTTCMHSCSRDPAPTL